MHELFIELLLLAVMVRGSGRRLSTGLCREALLSLSLVQERASLAVRVWQLVVERRLGLGVPEVAGLAAHLVVFLYSGQQLFIYILTGLYLISTREKSVDVGVAVGDAAAALDRRAVQLGRHPVEEGVEDVRLDSVRVEVQAVE